MSPRVVGLMPTFNRPEMAHRAAHMFLAQDYPGQRDLIVYDDGDQKFEPCNTCAPHLRLVRSSWMRLPEKRNKMIADDGDRDAIFVTWDDDDYHGPSRISRQVEAITAGSSRIQACILRPTLYYNSITHEVAVSTWLSDGTLAHTWDCWQRNGGYPTQRDPGSGWEFCNRIKREIIEIDGELDYCVIVHAAQRHTPPAFNPMDFSPASISADELRERLG